MDLAAATAYLTSLLKKEGFQNAPKKEEKTYGQLFGVGGMVVFIVYFIILFLQSCAGARLSWCYNQSIGTGTALAIFYAILCFFFPGVYMVFYTFFLAPMCAGKEENTNVIKNILNNASSRPLAGGRRH